MKTRKVLAALAIIPMIIIAGCKKDDYVGKVGVCPAVISTIPANEATGVPVNQVISVTFNEKMNPATINQSTFSLQGPTKVTGTLTYDGSGPTFTFTPSTPLLYKTQYTGKVTTGAKDNFGQALQKDYTWTFTTVEQFTVTLSSNPAAGGTTAGGGSYDAGSTVNVSATAASGYTFANWTEGTTVVSTDANYSFAISSNRTLVANFTENIKVYTVSVSASPAAGGTATGGGSYNAGTAVVVKATPNAGYTFVNWTEGSTVVSTDANYTFIIGGNRTLVANFTEAAKLFTVATSANPPSAGTTTGDGSYASGTSVTVKATATSGYTFANWTEGTTVVSTDANYTFTISANRILVANFTENIKVYNVTVAANPPAAGSASGAGSFNSGTQVTVTATPNAGYSFTNWTENGTVVSSSATYTFTITANRNLVANFKLTVFNINLSSNPAAGGTTTGGGAYDAFTSVTVKAVANPGYTFANWTEGGTVVSEGPEFTFTVTGTRNLVANFNLIPVYDISLSATPPAGGTTAGGGSFMEGTTITVTASANAGYYFAAWTEGYDVVSTDPAYTFTVTGNRTLKANFRESIAVYTLAVSTFPANGGFATGGGSFTTGTSVTVSALPSPGYNFVNWTDGGTVVSTSATYTFSISHNTTLVANFAKITETYCILLSTNPPDAGYTRGGGNYIKGTTATIVSVPTGDYVFAYWSENGVAVSTDASYTFKVDRGRTLVANYFRLPRPSASAQTINQNK